MKTSLVIDDITPRNAAYISAIAKALQGDDRVPSDVLSYAVFELLRQWRSYLCSATGTKNMKLSEKANSFITEIADLI